MTVMAYLADGEVVEIEVPGSVLSRPKLQSLGVQGWVRGKARNIDVWVQVSQITHLAEL